MWKKIPDSFWLGTVSGMGTLFLFYLVLAYSRLLLVNYYQNPYLLQAPRIQLFSIFLNVLFFRLLMINLDKEKFGKGVLLATVCAAFVYFFYYFNYHQVPSGS